ncbi:hypothetical protein M9H77_13108 [Catharanthus roseus]|uniref:Uncharacterized protein n=1 Tax=Catharanthus roseus TaxID=4058 RepID=A0ACC0BJG7_CATRO|nr:hypothetical protein M9H77_13108 [Catharanthus roseus]
MGKDRTDEENEKKKKENRRRRGKTGSFRKLYSRLEFPALLTVLVRPRILDVPLVDIPFQEDVDIAEISRIDVGVQDVGTHVHESGELELVDICRRSSIVDEDENNEDKEEFEWESDEEEEEKSFNWSPILKRRIFNWKRAHPAVASFPSGMSPSPIATSTPLGTFTPPAVASIPPTTLTLFLQLPYSSLAPTSTLSFGFICCGDVIEACPFIRPLTCSFIQGVVDSPIRILPTTEGGEDGQGFCIVGPVYSTASAEGTSAAVTVEHRGGSSSLLSVPFSLSSVVVHEAFIKRERRLWGYMQQVQGKFASFMISFPSQCEVQLDSLPTFFPPFPLSDDDATSQPPPTGPPSSSSPPPPTQTL